MFRGSGQIDDLVSFIMTNNNANKKKKKNKKTNKKGKENTSTNKLENTGTTPNRKPLFEKSIEEISTTDMDFDANKCENFINNDKDSNNNSDIRVNDCLMCFENYLRTFVIRKCEHVLPSNEKKELIQDSIFQQEKTRKALNF